MFKRLLTGIFGSRHDRRRRQLQPIVDEINEHYARLQTVSDAELQGQTAKFREIIRERTDALEASAAELRERKRGTSDPVERDQIDEELSGTDGRGGVDGQLRE